MKIVNKNKIYTLEEAKKQKDLVIVVSDKEYETLIEDYEIN